MSSPIVGVRRPSAGSLSLGPTERFAAGQRGYRLLGWFGLALGAMAGADMALALYPTALGSAEWVFTTTMQTFSGLPVLAVALGGLTVAALAEGGKVLPRLIGALNVAVVLLVVGMLVLFVPAAGEGLQRGAEVAQAGIRKVIFRVGLFAVVFGVLHVVLAVRCFRAVGGPARSAA